MARASGERGRTKTASRQCDAVEVGGKGKLKEIEFLQHGEGLIWILLAKSVSFDEHGFC